ncbi:Ras GTPase-activating protein 1 [Balamuthia mandrillaris]
MSLRMERKDSFKSLSSAEGSALMQFQEFLIHEFPFLEVFKRSTLDAEQFWDFGSSLLYIMHNHDEEHALKFLESAIKQKVEQTADESLLFRDTNLVTCMMSEYIQMVGGNLVVDLEAVIANLLDHPVSTEVDAARAGSEEEVKKNQENVIELTGHFLEAIISTQDQMPGSIKRLSQFFYAMVEEKFSGSGYKHLGGFLFLRFFCPIIVTPEAFGLFADRVDELKKIRRNLVLIAKIIQGVVNEVEFEKESYMICFNDFIVEHIPIVHKFFEAVLEKKEPKLTSTKSIKRIAFGLSKDKVNVASTENVKVEEILETTLLSIFHFLDQNFTQLKEGKPPFFLLSSLLLFSFTDWLMLFLVKVDP